MRQGRTKRFLTQRFDGTLGAREPDQLIVEEPMTIQLDGVAVSTTMRTPGHDFELAVGFCLAEGWLDGATVRQVRYCATQSAAEGEFNVVSVDTGASAPAPKPRLGSTTSACGVCGSQSIHELAARLAPLRAERFEWSLLAAAAASMTERAELFGITGAVHSAAAFDRRGEVLVMREDIGRHNAVDKVVGRLYLDSRLPAGELALFVSGRASFEMVQKAWAAGFAALVAVSAPSALAVETAQAGGLQLAGFARGGSLKAYAHGHN